MDEYVTMTKGDQVLKGVHRDAVLAHEAIGWKVAEKPAKAPVEKLAAEPAAKPAPAAKKGKRK